MPMRRRLFTLLNTGEEYFVWGAYIRYYCVAGKILCVLGNFGRLRRVIWRNFAGRIQIYSIRHCDAVNCILDINASLLICNGPSAITIVFDVKYTVYPVNPDLFLLMMLRCFYRTLRWRHNGRDLVSNHQPHDCLLNRLFGRRSKETSKLHVTGLCVGNSPGTGEFPAQMASNAENVSIWWRQHVYTLKHLLSKIQCR